MASPNPLLQAVTERGIDALRKETPGTIAALLSSAAQAYYHTSAAVLSDDLFDAIKAYLHERAPKHAFFKAVGAPVLHGEKVELPMWMGSLDKIRDDPAALTKWAAKYPGHAVVSDKLDGNSALLEIHADGTMRMLSRGDGTHGQNIRGLLERMRPRLPTAEMARCLGAKPNAPALVRGEVILSKAAWARVSHKGANARNVVAGAMHAKTPDAEIADAIDFVAYELVRPRPASIAEGLATLKRCGLTTVVDHVRLPTAPLTMATLSARLLERRDASPYEIDGLVIMDDTPHPLAKGKNPKYGFAFKTLLTHEEAEVLVQSVEWNVSKDGYFKPTILFPPVVLDSVKIQRASGFNGAFIEKNKIGPGARVVIIRSGQVIPHVVRIVTPAAVASMPTMPYEWTDTHVDIKVVKANGKGDGDAHGPPMEQRISQLAHFVSKLSIDHVGPGTVKKLAEAGHDSIPKLFRLTKSELLTIDGFKDTSAAKVAESLKNVRDQVQCIDMMAASNMFGRGMGTRKMQVILKAFPEVLKGNAPTLEQLTAVDSVGAATAASFLEGLPKFFALMKEIGIPCRGPATQPALASPPIGADPTKIKALVDLKVVFTGFRNKEWEAAIEAAGGKVSTSISGNTKLVVAANPDEASGKLEKARALGIRILSKEAFEREFM